ncbi:HIT family protein [Actinopolymorpha sp. B11F2]|uniref:HIT family protein n=1 Tax=Actinopolymorpha sp. B11F2 TaxID=3160862 RepID=UPI0032E4E0A2
MAHSLVMAVGDARDGGRSQEPSSGSGSVWSRPQDWQDRKSTAACPICRDGGPTNVLVEFAASVACAGPSAPLPGYVCMVARRHVVEPFELPGLELRQFWDEAMLVARALNTLFTPAKINYEIHGNTMPHLHMHLHPRFAGDPYVGGPISWRASFDRSPQDRQAIADAIRREQTATVESQR